MRAHQFVVSVVAVSLIGLAWIIPQRGTADQPGMSAFPGDVIGNGVIDAQDLVAVVLSLGPCQGCPAEMNGDGVVDAWEVLAIIAGMGQGAGDEPPMAYGSGMHTCAVEDSAFATAEGGCKDLATGLVWSTNGMGHGVNYNWSTSVGFIEASEEGGVTDWRMPTLNEWLEVIDNGAAGHFGGGHVVTGGTRYWSSTTQGNKAWSVVIQTSATFKNPKYDFLYFAGVRVAPPPGSPCNNNGMCESGENCENCGDCDGKLNGPPSGRYCCGNGVSEPPEVDGRCDGNN